jgi:hypothetical protein
MVSAGLFVHVFRCCHGRANAASNGSADYGAVPAAKLVPDSGASRATETTANRRIQSGAVRYGHCRGQ